MSRLIDANVACKGCVRYGTSLSCEECVVKEAPTVDAVPVTRCWECDYSSMEGWYCTGCGLMPAHKTFPHEYCSHGALKKNE